VDDEAQSLSASWNPVIRKVVRHARSTSSGEQVLPLRRVADATVAHPGGYELTGSHNHPALCLVNVARGTDAGRGSRGILARGCRRARTGSTQRMELVG
jgi:hypothetical protein